MNSLIKKYLPWASELLPCWVCTWLETSTSSCPSCIMQQFSQVALIFYFLETNIINFDLCLFFIYAVSSVFLFCCFSDNLTIYAFCFISDIQFPLFLFRLGTNTNVLMEAEQMQLFQASNCSSAGQLLGRVLKPFVIHLMSSRRDSRYISSAEKVYIGLNYFSSTVVKISNNMNLVQVSYFFHQPPWVFILTCMLSSTSFDKKEADLSHVSCPVLLLDYLQLTHIKTKMELY